MDGVGYFSQNVHWWFMDWFSWLWTIRPEVGSKLGVVLVKKLILKVAKKGVMLMMDIIKNKNSNLHRGPKKIEKFQKI